VRSFGSKDQKTVSQKYATIHTEAEAHFEPLRTGRSVTDESLKTAASAIVPGITGENRLVLEKENFRKVLDHRGGRCLDGLNEADRDALAVEVMRLYASDDLVLLDQFRSNVDVRAAEAGALVQVRVSKSKTILTRAFDEAWSQVRRLCQTAGRAKWELGRCRNLKTYFAYQASLHTRSSNLISTVR
jgi:hypothetical protein